MRGSEGLNIYVGPVIRGERGQGASRRGLLVHSDQVLPSHLCPVLQEFPAGVCMWQVLDLNLQALVGR